MSLIEVETTGFPAARYSGVFVGLILVRIADSPEEFISAVSESLKPMPQGWIESVDQFLSSNSWDTTWNRMWKLVTQVLQAESAQQEDAEELEIEAIEESHGS
jgi:hypothetical protein